MPNIVCLSQRAVEGSRAITTLDKSNAFKRASMAEAAEILHEREQEEVGYVAKMLSTHRVVSAEGNFLATHIPQGSNLGSTAMAYIIDKALEEPRTTRTDSVILSLADDISIISPSIANAKAIERDMGPRLAASGMVRMRWTTHKILLKRSPFILELNNHDAFMSSGERGLYSCIKCQGAAEGMHCTSLSPFYIGDGRKRCSIRLTKAT